jgi:hypothetical protein
MAFLSPDAAYKPYLIADNTQLFISLYELPMHVLLQMVHSALAFVPSVWELALNINSTDPAGMVLQAMTSVLLQLQVFKLAF